MARGRIVARVFASDAEIPLYNAAVRITQENGNGEKELLAFRLTDGDGLTGAVSIDTPAAPESQSFGSGAPPFTGVDMMAEQPGYDRVLVKNVQVFPAVETRQAFKLIPTAEYPDAYDKTAVFNITPQDL